MRRFLLRSLLFALCAFAVFIAMWIPFAISARKCMKINHNQRILFLGNSHIECGINDKIVTNSINYARSGERMEFVYNKMKMLCNSNAIDTIYLGLDSYLLTTSSEKCVPPSFMHNPWLMSENSVGDWWEILKNGSFEYVVGHFSRVYEYLKLYNLYQNIKYNNAEASQLGGYLYLQRDKLDEAINRQNGKSHPITIGDLDRLNLYFLDRIVGYCSANGIVLCFITPPQHRLAPEDMILCHQLHRERYSDISLLDFRYMELPDSCFGDLDHLNYRGAKIFSEYLEKEVIHKNNYPSSRMPDAVIN